jgi:hypothetical protein
MDQGYMTIVSYMDSTHSIDETEEEYSPQRDHAINSNFRDRAFSWDCKYY